MLVLDKVSVALGTAEVLKGVSWHIGPGARVGLVGRNGAGKSTLLKVAAGILKPDMGKVHLKRGWNVGYLPQLGLNYRNESVIQEVVSSATDAVSLSGRLEELGEKLAREKDPVNKEALLEEFGEVEAELSRIGGYDIEARAAVVLEGLGFSAQDRERPCREFSGGWQMRIGLAKLLLAAPDVLLLDEPTNHLDLYSRDWLEDFLKEYSGAVVVVSHDRYFLDVLVDRITEVEDGALVEYKGNYTAYEQEKQQRLERSWAEYRRAVEEVERQKRFVDKFKYNAARASQVQSRVKMLEKMEIPRRPSAPPKAMKVNLPDPPKCSDLVAVLKGIKKTYGRNTVFQSADLVVEKGDRLALLGRNGAGKTTLVKILSGKLEFDAGTRKLGKGVVVDHLAQDATMLFDPEKTVYETMLAAAPYEDVPGLRDLLAAFLFRGDDVNKPVAGLSGGELTRLAVAGMLLKRSNFLLLDEPTNHLDLHSKAALLAALQSYKGTLVFVSHDRHFIDSLATKVAEVGGGEVVLHHGNYSDLVYRKKRMSAGPVSGLLGQEERGSRLYDLSQATNHGKSFGCPGKAERIMSREEEKKRKRIAQRRQRRMAALEEEIASLENEVRELGNKMVLPHVASNPQELLKLHKEEQELKARIDELMNQWAELAEEDEYNRN